MRTRNAVWEPGIYDVDGANLCQQWWETASHQAAFVNGLRDALDLDPLPEKGRRAARERGR